VDRDKSIEGFIGSGRTEYAGMAEMRDWLILLRDDPDGVFREQVRRNGMPGNGPLRVEVREQVLERLLKLQDELGEELISPEEVALIKQVWISDSLID
jgi:DNA sulfur modification protein DndC